jgi:XTP/dITP diphosphohydrolase
MGRLTALLASSNEHKLRELRDALPGFELGLLDAGPLPPETGDTYFENAWVKAAFGRKHGPAEAWTLGEDSGIEVDGLGGEPGIRSARWAGDEDPVVALLRRLEGVEGAGRRARYRCELVAYSPDRREWRGSGVLEGTIAAEPRGSEGFGYDPVFVPEGETRTVAELGDAWKRRNSHRARAARALAEALGR